MGAYLHTHIPKWLWWMSEKRMSPLTFTRSKRSSFERSMQNPRTCSRERVRMAVGVGKGREGGRERRKTAQKRT